MMAATNSSSSGGSGGEKGFFSYVLRHGGASKKFEPVSGLHISNPRRVFQQQQSHCHLVWWSLQYLVPDHFFLDAKEITANSESVLAMYTNEKKTISSNKESHLFRAVPLPYPACKALFYGDVLFIMYKVTRETLLPDSGGSAPAAAAVFSFVQLSPSVLRKLMIQWTNNCHRHAVSSGACQCTQECELLVSDRQHQIRFKGATDVAAAAVGGLDEMMMVDTNTHESPGLPGWMNLRITSSRQRSTTGRKRSTAAAATAAAAAPRRKALKRKRADEPDETLMSDDESSGGGATADQDSSSSRRRQQQRDLLLVGNTTEEEDEDEPPSSSEDISNYMSEEEEGDEDVVAAAAAALLSDDEDDSSSSILLGHL